MDAGGHDVAISLQRLVARRRGEQFRDAGLPFGWMLRVAGMEVVFSAAGVRIDEQEALVLARHRREHIQQQDVLVDVGEISGVILMAIFHGTLGTREPRLYTVMRTLMKTLGWLICLGGAVSAGAADSSVTGVAPPTRIPNADTVAPLPQGTPIATALVPQAVRRAVVADAAKRFNVAES